MARRSCATAGSRLRSPPAPRRPRRASQPALPQARQHRPAAGRPEDGDVARRPDRHPGGRLALDLRRGEPRSWSTAGAPNPTRSPSASAPRSPTTRCSPPASTERASQLRVVFDSRPACRSTASSSRPSTRRRSSSSPPRRASRPRQRARDAGAEVLIAGATPPIESPPRSRARPPRHHQPLARGRPNPRLCLPRRRPDRRVPYLRRPDAARSRPLRHLARVATNRGLRRQAEPYGDRTRAPRSPVPNRRPDRPRHPDQARPSRSGECSPG